MALLNITRIPQAGTPILLIIMAVFLSKIPQISLIPILGLISNIEVSRGKITLLKNRYITCLMAQEKTLISSKSLINTFFPKPL
jgi:hypothetical protein